MLIQQAGSWPGGLSLSRQLLVGWRTRVDARKRLVRSSTIGAACKYLCLSVRELLLVLELLFWALAT